MEGWVDEEHASTPTSVPSSHLVVDSIPSCSSARIFTGRPLDFTHLSAIVLVSSSLPSLHALAKYQTRLRSLKAFASIVLSHQKVACVLGRGRGMSVEGGLQRDRTRGRVSLNELRLIRFEAHLEMQSVILYGNTNDFFRSRRSLGIPNFHSRFSLNF